SVFKVRGQLLLRGTGTVSTPECFVVTRAGIRRMVQDDEDKIDAAGHAPQLVPEPPTLRTTRLVESAVEGEHQRIRNANRVEPAAMKSREAREVVFERNSDVAVQVMVPQRWIDLYLVFVPDRGFPIVYFPVIDIVAVVSDITAKCNKVRMRFGDRANQLL